MLEPSLVSIIIPTYNRAHLIIETLESVTKQSYKNWECILVDDGSTDATSQVVGNYISDKPRFSYHNRPVEKPKGANACRNYGLELSRGIYINFFDSDDLMHEDKLKLQVASLDHGVEDFNVCQTLVFEGVFAGKGVLRSQLLRTEDPFNDFISHKIKWLTQAPMLRRTVLEQHQICFNEELQQSQELDLFVRLLARTTSYSVIEQPLVFLRMHGDSISYGSFTLEKLTSSFRVRHQFLIDFEERINETSRKVVLKELIALYGDYLKNKKKLTNSPSHFYKMIKSQLATKEQRRLLFRMKYSYKILNKGEWFKARLQATL